MSYSKYSWADGASGNTPITATRLNAIEQGIADAAAAADAAVKRTGNESIDGVKTFTSAPAVPDNSFTISDTNGLQTSLDNRLRVDAAQSFTTAQKTQAKTNLGIGMTVAAARTVTDPTLTDAQALSLVGEGGYFTVDSA
jgi:hypothetical protein